MKEISKLLKTISHRPWTLPTGQWKYYQEWNNAIFLHWRVDVETIRPLIPQDLPIDTIHGDTWISLVAFSMESIRPKNLPALAAISNFHEINVRAYVYKNNKPGVFFLNIEAQKSVSVLIARSLSGLPYEKSKISRTRKGDLFTYVSRNQVKDFNLTLLYEIDPGGYEKTKLDRWLTERYCLYLVDKNHLYRYDIHHEEWNIKKVNLKELSLQYQIGQLCIHEKRPDIAHFSEGVSVVVWKRQKISK